MITDGGRLAHVQWVALFPRLGGQPDDVLRVYEVVRRKAGDELHRVLGGGPERRRICLGGSARLPRRYGDGHWLRRTVEDEVAALAFEDLLIGIERFCIWIPRLRRLHGCRLVDVGPRDGEREEPADHVPPRLQRHLMWRVGGLALLGRGHGHRGVDGQAGAEVVGSSVARDEPEGRARRKRRKIRILGVPFLRRVPAQQAPPVRVVGQAVVIAEDATGAGVVQQQGRRHDGVLTRREATLRGK